MVVCLKALTNCTQHVVNSYYDLTRLSFMLLEVLKTPHIQTSPFPSALRRSFHMKLSDFPVDLFLSSSPPPLLPKSTPFAILLSIFCFE